MAGDSLILHMTLGASAALLTSGSFAAWASANAAKRLAAIAVALIGALLAAAALNAPAALLVTGAAAGFAYLAVGAAVVVRLQESYGGIETPQIDAEDAREDSAGPAE
jgi:hypothetical protein